MISNVYSKISKTYKAINSESITLSRSNNGHCQQSRMITADLNTLVCKVTHAAILARQNSVQNPQTNSKVVDQNIHYCNPHSCGFPGTVGCKYCSMEWQLDVSSVMNNVKSVKCKLQATVSKSESLEVNCWKSLSRWDQFLDENWALDPGVWKDLSWNSNEHWDRVVHSAI